MSDALGPRWAMRIAMLLVACGAAVSFVYLLYQWQWIGRP